MLRGAERGEVKFPTIVWVALFILVLWQLYKGLFIQEFGVGPFTFKFGQSRELTPPSPPGRQFTLTGAWTYTGHSNKTSLECTRSIQITTNGNQVLGVMSPCDDSRGAVEGTFDGRTLAMRRDTGINNTTQKMILTKQSDNKFVGRYWNEGSNQNQDEGSMEMER